MVAYINLGAILDHRHRLLFQVDLEFGLAIDR